jgi:uncharacterized alpha-E superfamily protein
LVEITGDMKKFMARYGQTTSENVMHFLMCNPEYPNSIASCLRAARDNAMGLRESMPSDMFEQINRMGKLVPEATREKAYFHSRVFDLCRQIKREGILLSGIVSETIERGRGYHFWRLGEFLERADKTSRLLHVKYFYLLPQVRDVGSPIDVVQWSALLLSLDAREAYYRTHGLIEPNKVVEMIVLDRGFPRAILFCLRSALESLNRITRDVPGAPHELLQQLCAKLENMTAQEIVDIGLNEFIDDLQIRINEVNDAIYTHFHTFDLPAAGA